MISPSPKLKEDESPSARKVWIEIVATHNLAVVPEVTFREEGVD